MATIEVQFDTKKALMNFSVVRGGLIDAARNTLNEMAMVGAFEQRKHLARIFTIRNKWIMGSIWPKRGKRKGLVPTWSRDISKMYSTTGTSSPLLEKQERGFVKKNPSVPSDDARVGRSHKRIIRKKNRLRNIDNNRTLTPSKSMASVENHKDRVSVLLAVANKINWKGMILIEDDAVMPAGYYQIQGGSLKLLRTNQKGAMPRHAKHWHEDSIRNSRLNRNAQKFFDKNARIALGGLY